MAKVILNVGNFFCREAQNDGLPRRLTRQSRKVVEGIKRTAHIYFSLSRWLVDLSTMLSWDIRG